MSVDVDAILKPWFEATMAAAGHPPLLDAHTHIGFNDPDGMTSSPESLLAMLATPGARGLTFPMHEPDGYHAANDAVRAAAEASGGVLDWLCRVDPRGDALAEATRCLDAGARGIKLHPRAEAFAMDEPAVRDLVALAHERRAAVLIHAGRGIPALGENAVRLNAEFPDARFILAHCAISDLAWIWRELPDHPNVYIDTSWWHPADYIALFSLCPPGQVLWASDAPYGLPLTSAVITARCALQAGLTQEQVRSVLGAQAERVLAGEDALDLGPAPNAFHAIHPLLERVVAYLTVALGRMWTQADPSEAFALARVSCAVGEDGPHAELFGEILELLDLIDRYRDAAPPEGQLFPPSSRLAVAALTLARTPDVPLPERLTAPPPTQEHAEHRD
jgi:predicted TIM-barrel fold metal-dependent hydrolase